MPAPMVRLPLVRVASATSPVVSRTSSITFIVMMRIVLPSALLLLVQGSSPSGAAAIAPRPHHDTRQSTCGSGRRSSVTAALLQGGRGAVSSKPITRIEDEGHFTSSEGGIDGMDNGAATFVDPSWTPAAFRAFHEMRAGPLALSPPVVAATEGGGAANLAPSDRGLLQGVRRRLASFAMRAPTSAGDKDISTADAPSPSRGSAKPAACWHMKGRLTSAESGRTIALVEGVELARSLAFEVGDRGRRGGYGDSSNQHDHDDGRELEVDRVLRKPGMWNAFGVLASSKFFMYQNPETGEPMETFRHTPVDKKMPVRTYERFSQVVSHLLQPSGRILVVSEWAGRAVKAVASNMNGVEEVGADVGQSLVRGGGGGGGDSRRVFNFHFFVEARTPKEERELKRRENRPGAKWIEFGSTPPPSHGCREVYSYVSGGSGGGKMGNVGITKNKDRRKMTSEVGKPSKGDTDSGAMGRGRRGRRRLPGGGGSDGGGAVTASSGKNPTEGNAAEGFLTYTRYGECPAWYGAGQMCGLDVQAKRVGSFAELPAKLRKRVLDVDPSFESGLPGSLEECRDRAALEKQARKEEWLKHRRSWKRPFGNWGAMDE